MARRNAGLGGDILERHARPRALPEALADRHDLVRFRLVHYDPLGAMR
jgi:hypothetical protein